MLQDVRRMMLGVASTLRLWRASLSSTVQTRWGQVTREERIRLRNHGLAISAAVVTTLLSLGIGLQTAGPLLLVDVVVAAAAWFGGLSTGTTAALTALLTVRVVSIPILGTPFAASIAVLALAKWLLAALAAAALSARVRQDAEQITALEDRIQGLYADVHATREALRQTEVTSASANALLRDDADLARQQLTALQSVTDPALNALSGVELVSALLDRLRVAVDADGVAIYQHHGLRGRMFSAGTGVAPSGNAMRRQPASGYQTGRATLIHNDSERVAETSLCQWPPDIASLILVPVVYSGRLQLVVEVAGRRARRSTEWELALIQVVAERAAGLLRPDANFDSGAVA
jgi:hypothetical protein